MLSAECVSASLCCNMTLLAGWNSPLFIPISWRLNVNYIQWNPPTGEMKFWSLYSYGNILMINSCMCCHPLILRLFARTVCNVTCTAPTANQDASWVSWLTNEEVKTNGDLQYRGQSAQCCSPSYLFSKLTHTTHTTTFSYSFVFLAYCGLKK